MLQQSTQIQNTSTHTCTQTHMHAYPETHTNTHSGGKICATGILMHTHANICYTLILIIKFNLIMHTVNVYEDTIMLV